MTISNRQTKSRPKVIVKVSCNLKIVKGQKALAQASTKVSSKARKRKKKEKKIPRTRDEMRLKPCMSFVNGGLNFVRRDSRLL